MHISQSPTVLQTFLVKMMIFLSIENQIQISDRCLRSLYFVFIFSKKKGYQTWSIYLIKNVYMTYVLFCRIPACRRFQMSSLKIHWWVVVLKSTSPRVLYLHLVFGTSFMSASFLVNLLRQFLYLRNLTKIPELGRIFNPNRSSYINWKI